MKKKKGWKGRNNNGGWKERLNKKNERKDGEGWRKEGRRKGKK